MNPQRDKYLEALGIPDFLYASVSPEGTAQENFKLLVVELDSQGSFCQAGASQDLLFKMLASIGLSLNDCNLLSVSKSEVDTVIQKHASDVRLVMDSSIALDSNTLFVTHPTKDIIEDPKLKRDSWEVLKQVKLCLK